jgi:DNA mismatch endonuclease (patch repair protein)
MKRSLPAFQKPDAIRSANMRAVTSKGNRTTEWRLRSLLIRHGIRGWTIGSTKFLGTPDFVFPDQNLVVFIDGCFWHGCALCGHTPKTNRQYWIAKIERNKLRDKRISSSLRGQGFTVIRIRECALKKNPARCLQRILSVIESVISRKARR